MKEALLAIQSKYFRDNYDLAALLKERIESTDADIRRIEEEDEDELLDVYRDSLKRLKRIATRPLPRQIQKQIELLRRVEALGGSEVGNILDIRGVSKTRQPFKVRPLVPDEINTLFNCERPISKEAEKWLYRAYDLIDRAEAVCFPVYRAAEPKRAIGWCYVGYTAD